ncbi:MAG: SOS response-associated peptidase [Gammaproteobacteria bacterium]|nr:SOS response-associated peptidase [Gammaproteobacteria bacterium]
MCGRFAFYSPAEAVSRLFSVEDPPQIEPRYNIAPTQFVPIVRDHEDEPRTVSMLRWGLLPFWAKDKSIASRLINARAETVAEKPAYRDSFKKRRCIVPVNGFYEWVKQGSSKQPYFISQGGDEPFGLAGLWSTWRDKKNEDEIIETFTIITTTANEAIAALHHRMPVVLATDDYDEWLAVDHENASDLQRLLVPAPPESFKNWPVSRQVNNARNEGPELVTPDSLV